MGSVNLVMVMGEIDRDAVLKDAGGTPLSEFIVTTREAWTDRHQKHQERIEKHQIQLWGKLAETLTPRLRKGQPVYVEGKVETRQWQDREQKKHYDTYIRAKRVDLLSAIPPEQPGDEPPPTREEPDDPIPF